MIGGTDTHGVAAQLIQADPQQGKVPPGRETDQRVLG